MLASTSASSWWFVPRRLLAIGLAAGGLAGCHGPQSALDPASRHAQQLADLFWWMTGGAALIWIGMIVLTLWAIRAGQRGDGPRRTPMLIIGGGVVVPTVVLAGLLAYGLALLPPLLAAAPPGSLRIEVIGEQWWWRIRYHPPRGEPFELANEIRLPVGEPVEFELTSPDVIHAFWIPALGGKIDMIPGRRNRLMLEPGRIGTYRGVCAEYCGTSHALMAFDVVVTSREDFDRWMETQRADAASPPAGAAALGRDRFFANGCSACHRVRGTDAAGVIGPDLTHLASRLTIGAGTLPNHPDALVRWLAETPQVKPGVLMPHYGMLPPAELDALAAYLASLR